MFCGNCGMKNDDSAVFCIDCGAKLEEEPVFVNPVNPVDPVAPTPKANNKKLLIAVGAAVLAVVVALILIFTLAGNGAGSPKAVVEKYIKAMEKGDGKAVLKLMHKEMIKEDIGDKDDQKDYIENVEDGFEQLEDYDAEFEIVDVEDVDDDDLDDIQDEYEDDYDLKVKDSKYVVVEMNMTIMGYEYNEEVRLLVIKVGGRWYMGDTF